MTLCYLFEKHNYIMFDHSVNDQIHMTRHGSSLTMLSAGCAYDQPYAPLGGDSGYTLIVYWGGAALKGVALL